MRCSFCTREIPFGRGITFVKKEGKALNFCTSKCQKHQLKLKHKARETGWTEEYKKLKKQTKK